MISGCPTVSTQFIMSPLFSLAQVTYFWQPLSGTDLFLAIVIPTDRQQQSLFPGVPTDPGHM